MDNSAWSSVNYTVEQVKDENPEVWIASAIENIEAGFYDEAMEELDEAISLATLSIDAAIVPEITDMNSMKKLDEVIRLASTDRSVINKAKAEKIRVYYILGDIYSARDMLNSFGEQEAERYYRDLPDLVFTFRKYDYSLWQPFWQKSVAYHMEKSDFYFIDRYIADIEDEWLANWFGVDKYVEYVLKNNNEAILNRLIEGLNLSDMKFADGKNLLMIAIANQCRDSIIKTVVVKCTKTMDYQDRHGCTALQDACRYSNKDIVELILKYGADTDIANSNGDVALHFAVEKANYESVLVLLEYGAEINVSNTQYVTPLHTACVTKNVSLTQLLLSKGGDPNKINSQSVSPLALAAIQDSGTIAKVLIEYGAYVHEKVSKEKINWIILTLLKYRAQSAYKAELDNVWGVLNDKDVYDGDILFIAYKSNSMSVLNCLLDSGVDVNQRYKSKHNRNLLHCLAADNHWSTEGKEMWQYLLGAGIDINAQDGDGNTAAMLSVDHSWVFSDELDLVRALVKRGANLNLRNNANETIDDILRKNNIKKSKLFDNSSTNFFLNLFS